MSDAVTYDSFDSEFDLLRIDEECWCSPGGDDGCPDLPKECL